MQLLYSLIAFDNAGKIKNNTIPTFADMVGLSIEIIIYSIIPLLIGVNPEPSTKEQRSDLYQL